MFVCKYIVNIYVTEAKIDSGYNLCKFLDMIYIIEFKYLHY